VPPGGTTGRIILRHRRDVNGRPLITEVHVVDDEGVPAALLREIPLGALEDVLSAPVTLDVGDESEIDDAARGVAGWVGRLKLSDPADVEQLTQVMELWQYAQANGLPPAKYVAQKLRISERTVARRIADLRKHALLPSPRRTRRRGT
jgi:hypothetical protein